ncbi:hypothetical protein AOC36_02925 [Erysipelothrix larvae]|uniref:DUF4194 domain-containing protein n=1 Tax=Erysipelothrix larvae TaxID=1514105 RepID=A0A120JTI1_9FIRM|nr:DUF4194 domain-containing protein [Erysipelothrix larvae]AMC92970.1 hypothetical protein AOC36_02925 [Erysipelothrix larvae]
MNKAEELKNFSMKFSRQTEKEQEQFSEIVNKLLRCNYLCRDNPSDRSHYFDALIIREDMRAYLSIIDTDIIIDELNGVIGLKVNGESSHHRLRLRETIILLCLRKLFFIKKQSVSMIDTIAVTLEEIMQELLNTGYFEKGVGKTEFETTLRKLKSYHLIDYSFTQSPDVIILWPSLLHAVNANTLEEIQKKLDVYKDNMEVDDENTEEDKAD